MEKSFKHIPNLLLNHALLGGGRGGGDWDGGGG